MSAPDQATVDEPRRAHRRRRSLALAPDYSGCALAVVRALIRRAPASCELIGVPQLGFQADLLIGAGCVASVESAAVTLGEQGPAPRFVAAVKAGAIEVRDSTCPVIHAGLQAAEKGVPFLPLRGILGSDLVRHRPDWQVIDNPFAATRRSDAPGAGDPARRRAVPCRAAPTAPATSGSACGAS